MLPHRLIRLSSPKLNYIIGAGAIILYADVIFHVIPTTSPDVTVVLCNVCIYSISKGLLVSIADVLLG